jgi:O-antigen ligase
MAMAMYWIARGAVLTERAVLGMFAALAGFGLYLAVTAILEQQQLLSFVYPRYIATSTFTEFLGRGRGPLLNPATNGLFLCAGWFCLLMFWPRVNRTGKMFLVVLSTIFLGGIFCTLTRCVWAAVLVGLMIVLLPSLPRRWAVWFASAVVLVGCVVVVTKWNDLQAFKRDKDVTVEEMSRSAGLRPIFAVIAWHMFLDRPILGCGYGQYPVESINYLSDRSTKLRLEKARIYVQHNVVLSLLTETGMIGSGLFVLLMLFWFQSGWITWSHGQAPFLYRQQGLVMMSVLAVYLVIGMFQDLTIAWMANQLIFFLAGVSRGLRDHLFPVLAPAPDARVVAQRIAPRITTPPRISLPDGTS